MSSVKIELGINPISSNELTTALQIIDTILADLSSQYPSKDISRSNTIWTEDDI